MKIRRTKLMRLIGKKYMLIFGQLFTAPKAVITDADWNHEAIHDRQQKEMLHIFFLLWYSIEWVVRLIQYRDKKLAYRNISFEREAYANEDNLQYLEGRPLFEFFEYMKKK